MQEIHPVLSTAALGEGELVHKSAEMMLEPMWESPRGNCCSQYRYRGVSQWNQDFVVSFLARNLRFQKGNFREQNGCWNEKSELLRECCGMCQRSGGRHRTEGTSPGSPWTLTLVSSGCKVCGAPLGAALSLFITVCSPSPSLLDQLLT